MCSLYTNLTLLSSAALLVTLGCNEFKGDQTTDARTPSARAETYQEGSPSRPNASKATIPALRDGDPIGSLFARAELRPIESGSSPNMTGNVELYGSQTSATMKIWVSNLSAGTYGVYLGKDCTAAAGMRDTNATDSKGVGSATVREGERRLGDLVVGPSGKAELSASVPYNYVDAPPLTDMAIILMPQSAEKMDHLQTKVACGEIDGGPGGS